MDARVVTLRDGHSGRADQAGPKSTANLSSDKTEPRMSQRPEVEVSFPNAPRPSAASAVNYFPMATAAPVALREGLEQARRQRHASQFRVVALVSPVQYDREDFSIWLSHLAAWRDMVRAVRSDIRRHSRICGPFDAVVWSDWESWSRSRQHVREILALLRHIKTQLAGGVSTAGIVGGVGPVSGGKGRGSESPPHDASPDASRSLRPIGHWTDASENPALAEPVAPEREVIISQHIGNGPAWFNRAMHKLARAHRVDFAPHNYGVRRRGGPRPGVEAATADTVPSLLVTPAEGTRQAGDGEGNLKSQISDLRNGEGEQ